MARELNFQFFDHCKIINTGMIPGMGNRGNYSGIATSNHKGLQILNNSIINTGFNPITVWGDSILIKNNYINKFCFLLQDGGGIYVARSSRPYGTEINGNIVLNGIGCTFGTPWNINQALGIYVDVWTDNYKIFNNSVANCRSVGIQIAGAVDTYVEGNTVFGCGFEFVFLGGKESANKSRHNRVKNNIFVSTAADGNYRAAKYGTYSYHTKDSIPQFADFDYNVYAKPLIDFSPHQQWNETFEVSNIDGPVFMSLVQWQAFSGRDRHSSKSPEGISGISEMQFHYNETNIAKSIPLPYPMIDLKGNKYTRSITLQPYTSVVLLKDNHAQNH